MVKLNDVGRREFLAAGAMLPGLARAAGLRPAFEVSASLYAWDLHDEGIEKILDNLQGMAAVNSVYLIALMHYEKRPLTSPVFPHNPVRKTWQAEDSRIYWRPDMQRYGRIKPRLSDFDWLNRTDWLKVLVEAARKRGLKTGVELSHTVLDADRAQGEFIDCVQRDITGEPRVVWGRGYPICLNSPDARRYVLGLFSDLAANYDLDYAQTCTLPFMPGGPEKGGCFCDSCLRAAKSAGFDLAKARAALKGNPKAQPGLDEWQSFRHRSVAQYYKVMHDGVHAIRPRIDLRFNDCFRNLAEWGVNLKALRPHLDSVRVMDYSEQRGDPAAMKGKREWLTVERQGLGKEFPLLSAIAVRPKATPELIREGVKIAVECGVDGITLGHYDGAEFPMLRAIREGLKENGMQVPAAPGRDAGRAMGAWLGAAIGDAMGGPVEGCHAAWIKKNIGEITGFLPFTRKLGPGGALHGEAGSITDDTYIRADIARFYLATERPRTPKMLAEWLLKNADFGMWWRPAVEALERIRDGKVSAESGGLTHKQGGGGAWWTPVGMVFAGDPKAAAAETRSLCRPWKAPLEQDILAAVHAGTAEAQRGRASVDSVVEAVLGACGPLAKKLMERAAEIARRAKSSDELIRELYAHCLVNKCTNETDGPMPEAEKPVDYVEWRDGKWYSSVLFAEQQPLALAAFVFGRGDPRKAIPQCVMIGRDCDSTASNVGGWCGGLHGESGLPKDWVRTVCEVNRRDFDLRGLGEKLLSVRG